MPDTFNYSAAMVYDTITVTGYYLITAVGGTGGGASGAGYNAEVDPYHEFTSTAPGGAGSLVEGTFYLQAGEVLDIAVGGAGGTGVGGVNPDGSYGGIGSGGGGGGSFVILQDGSSYTLLEAAGGGGGAGFSTNGNNNHAVAGNDATGTTTGGAGDQDVYGEFPPNQGGTDGSGGGGLEESGFGGAGGGGYDSDGGYGAAGFGIGFDNDMPPQTDGGALPLSGGDGRNGGAGGFGGGAGGGGQVGTSGGGGGGYSGGGGGNGGGGGGGGSYDGGTNPLIVATDNSLGNGTVTIDPLCYLRGTHILTSTGEIPVEDLAIGDRVVTRWQGIQTIKWIGRQSFAARFVKGNREKTPVRIKAGAFDDRVPARDLWVSPGHSMLLNDTLVLAKSLVNGVTISQDYASDEIHYYQIEFETHDCVIAEGAWSESYADAEGLRAQFHNAAEYEALYPDYRPPEELTLCAPRPERGPKLDLALRPVVARASADIDPGPLQGSIDLVNGPWKIEGWAQDEDHPELPVLLEVLIGDRPVGTVLACDYRRDLAEAGLGQGRCAFVFTSPVKILAAEAQALRVRRAADGEEIGMSSDCRAGLGIERPVEGAKNLTTFGNTNKLLVLAKQAPIVS